MVSGCCGATLTSSSCRCILICCSARRSLEEKAGLNSEDAWSIFPCRHVGNPPRCEVHQPWGEVHVCVCVWACAFGGSVRTHLRYGSSDDTLGEQCGSRSHSEGHLSGPAAALSVSLRWVLRVEGAGCGGVLGEGAREGLSNTLVPGKHGSTVRTGHFEI